MDMEIDTQYKTDPQMYGQLIIHKDAKAIQWKKTSFFSTSSKT